MIDNMEIRTDLINKLQSYIDNVCNIRNTCDVDLSIYEYGWINDNPKYRRLVAVEFNNYLEAILNHFKNIEPPTTSETKDALLLKTNDLEHKLNRVQFNTIPIIACQLATCSVSARNFAHLSLRWNDYVLKYCNSLPNL